MIVKLPAILSKVSSRKDRSFSLTFDTRELSGADAVTLMDNLLSEGYLLYSPNNDIEDTDVPQEKADAAMGNKTVSQRIRATLFVLWEQRGKQGTFEAFYNTMGERIIEQLKEKLD